MQFDHGKVSWENKFVSLLIILGTILSQDKGATWWVVVPQKADSCASPDNFATSNDVKELYGFQGLQFWNTLSIQIRGESMFSGIGIIS